jgi:hypothetical protein
MVEAGLCYESQLDLMINEMLERLRAIGVRLDLETRPREEIWRMFAESLALDAARDGNTYYEQCPHLKPVKRLLKANAFRLVFLGAAEKIRDFLPREAFIF